MQLTTVGTRAIYEPTSLWLTLVGDYIHSTINISSRNISINLFDTRIPINNNFTNEQYV
ncbi:MAG: hypothetical protein FWE04_02895 [Oscillospiraceae bacterium]|nr:hypothetical protein [Oscillospiraceae bacterium]